MEIINTKESYCMYCLSEPRKVIHLKIVDNEIDMCEKCLIKAVLMVRPMPVFNQEMAYLLKVKLYADKGENIGNNIKYENFINWVTAFLESK